MLDEIATQLGNKPFLFSDTFTAADLTFAALSAPVVVPRNYGVRLPTLEELDESYRDFVKQVHQHPAGQYALRLYETHRGSSSHQRGL